MTAECHIYQTLCALCHCYSLYKYSSIGRISVIRRSLCAHHFVLHCIIRVEQVSHEMRYNSQCEEQSTVHSNQHNVTASCTEARDLSQAPMKTSIYTSAVLQGEILGKPSLKAYIKFPAAACVL